MSSTQKNLSDLGHMQVPESKGVHVQVVVAAWNKDVTGALLKGCLELLTAKGAVAEVMEVPGSFELINGARLALERKPDAVICLGCVIRGETPHFDFICSGVAQGLAFLNASHTTPIIFGVLTVDNNRQALERAGGVHGNKGTEAAATALVMVSNRKKAGV